MKYLKLAVIALFVLFSVNNTNAQEENNKWAISLGVNVVDFFPNGSDIGQRFEDFTGTGDWNMMSSISSLTVERYLSNGFSLQLAGGINQITNIDANGDTDDFYYSLGLNVKYDLNNLVGDTGWFDPFVYLGANYVNVASLGEAMLGLGGGFNVWVSDSLGFAFQTGGNYNFADKVRNHLQSSLGVVFKFGE